MGTEYKDLKTKFQGLAVKLHEAIPETVGSFSKLHKASLADGAVSKKHKELIAIGIGIAGHCKGCLAFHVDGALKAGATREEICEAIGVAVMMGGGPSMIYGYQAFEALEEFSS